MRHHANPGSKPRRITRRDMLRLGSAAFAGAAFVGATVLGCGGGDGRRTVTVFSPMGEVKNLALRRQVERFMALRDDLRVELIPAPWDQGHAKLLTMIAGGNPPDVIAATGQWMAEFRAMGAIEDLTPWYASWPHRDAFTRTGLLRCESSMAIEDGRVYGLPLELTTRAMFYRRRWLDEQGLVPAATRTGWRALLERITDRDRYGYALRGARGGFWTWWPILEEFSGTNEWFDRDHNCIINSPAHVEGLTYWNDIYQDGLAPVDSVNWGYNELVQGFWSGVCGCIEQDPEVVRTCLEHGMDESTLVTAAMPAGPRAHVASNDIWILSISSAAKNTDDALAFYEWMMSPEQLIAYSKDASVLPTVKQGMDDPYFGQGFLQPFMDMATDTRFLQNWYPSYLPEMGEFIEVLVTEEQQKMLLGRQSPRETLDRLADFLDRAQRRHVDRHGPDTPRPPRPSDTPEPSVPSEPSGTSRPS
ncbi:MAG: sugar ABC transporter substrate-binding protein [Gemmatimonadetes bacterium]|nr:sugar ABC transporter substrate-binding protein [Gemmatimonadota bacterium]